MADTRADVVLASTTWTDLYAATGIAVGTAVDVFNKGSNAVVLAIKSTVPGSTDVGLPLYVGAVGSFAHVDAGESGLWAYCHDGISRLLVQE